MPIKANPDKINPHKADAEYIWKQVEDVVVPRLHLSAIERVIYYHLLRHSRLEGKRRYQFSISAIGRRTGLSFSTVRKAIHRLMALGALRLIRRSSEGHFVEVRVPEEIRTARGAAVHIRNTARLVDEQPQRPVAVRLAEIDFLQTRELRRSIHDREGGRCFYCLRRQTAYMRTLDHVVPRSLSGGYSYLNLVSACMDCNSHKGEKRAEDFLRWLYRERRLTAEDLTNRLRALKHLAAGNLRPPMHADPK
jgi:5-methylcytosine-specific restriction endonuclease McrA